MSPPWTDPRWRAEVVDWVRRWFAGAGVRLTGEITQPHVRPWSTVLRIPTDAGPLWFKAGGPGQRHEPALVAELARLAPEAVLEPLAVERWRGWMLLPDGGPRLREVVGSDEAALLRRWEQLLPGHAELQRRLAPHRDELAAAGTWSLPPEAVPATVERLLADLTCARPATPGGIDPQRAARIRARLPELAAGCAELSACGVPASLQHDDLHDGNVFTGGARVFDWGDAYLGMPFAVLLVVQSSVAARLSTSVDDPRITRLRRAYLEPWTDRHPAAELDRLALLAVQAAVVGRAVGWQRALGDASPEDLGTWGSAPAEWLGALLEPPPW